MYDYDYNSLYHHGVKGMKWGVRKENRYDVQGIRYRNERYINPDKTLTPDGERMKKIAEQRLRRRSIRLQRSTDRAAAMMFPSLANRSAKIERMGERTNDAIKSDDKRLVDFGRRTRTKQVVNKVGTAVGASMGTLLGLAAAGPSTPVIAALGLSAAVFGTPIAVAGAVRGHYLKQ